jgi:hypothetical protein
VVPADEVERLPWVPVPACPGVDEKTLWQFGGFVVAEVRYYPGSAVRGADISWHTTTYGWGPGAAR